MNDRAKSFVKEFLTEGTSVQARRPEGAGGGVRFQGGPLPHHSAEVSRASIFGNTW